MSDEPKILIIDETPVYKAWGTRWWNAEELINAYPIQNKNWTTMYDPLKEDTKENRKLLMETPTKLDPWNRKMIPWKWSRTHKDEEWAFEIPYVYITGHEAHPYERRYSSVDGLLVAFYKIGKFDVDAYRKSWKTKLGTHSV